MRESRTSGSVRGAPSDGRPYRDPGVRFVSSGQYRAISVFRRPHGFPSYPGGNFSDTGGEAPDPQYLSNGLQRLRLCRAWAAKQTEGAAPLALLLSAPRDGADPEISGAPCWTRTSDPQLRRLLLYPPELRAHKLIHRPVR